MEITANANHLPGTAVQSFIKTVLQRLFPLPCLHYRAYVNLVKNRNSYLYSTGWMRSLKERKPIDNNGLAIPWMNYAVISFLEERLSVKMNIFEFGSGYSTFFYARKAKHVTSVECNAEWFNFVQSHVPENVLLLFQKRDIDGEYCRLIGSTGYLYDIVVVDGVDRVNCVKQSISALTPEGCILIDDSHMDNHQEGIDFAKMHGFRALHYEGLKATGEGVDRTTILYRDGNCLEI